ncbi:MAG: AMP-binding protein, partial [Hyphomicrobiales bacterium]|nr:AMP-binding protein [Hyphomicrobiales bacterium]
MEFPRNYNAAVDLVDANVAAGRGDKAAFIDPNRTLTYGDLLAESSRFANLLNRLGIRRETRVAMIVLDTVDFPIVFLGAIRAGIVPVAINTLLTSDYYKYMLEDSRAEALVVSAPLYPTVAPIVDDIATLKHVIVAGGEAEGRLSLAAELASESPDFPAVDTIADEVCFWLYSSGSTGMPKGTRHVHSSMMVTAKCFGQALLGFRE